MELVEINREIVMGIIKNPITNIDLSCKKKKITKKTIVSINIH
jgi:hypothetical protein